MTDKYLGFTERQWEQLKTFGKGRNTKHFDRRGYFRESITYFQHPENAQPPKVQVTKVQQLRNISDTYKSDNEYSIHISGEDITYEFDSFEMIMDRLRTLKRQHPEWFVDGKIKETNTISVD